MFTSISLSLPTTLTLFGPFSVSTYYDMIVGEKAGGLYSLISKPPSFPLTTTQGTIVYFLITSGEIKFTILI